MLQTDRPPADGGIVPGSAAAPSAAPASGTTAGSAADRFPLGRRAFLTGLGVSGALLLSGCSLFGGGDAGTVTSTVFAPPPVDPIETLIAVTSFHLARLDAVLTAVEADPTTVAQLTPLRADRAAHLEALIAERGRTDAASGSSEPPAGTVTLPASAGADPVALKALLRGDAETAQGQFTDGVSATGRYRAALFASISACLATHRSVLT